MTSKRAARPERKAYTLMPKEVKTAVRWSFRALGIPAGYDRQAGEMVLYTEILYRKGLALLYEMLDRHDGIPKRVALHKNESPYPLIDAKFEHALLVMPGIFDYACAEAKIRELPFSVEIENIGPGSLFIEQLIVETAKRGLTCAWVPDKGIRWVANEQEIYKENSDLRFAHARPSRATLSVGITPKFKMLERYERYPVQEIDSHFLTAEKSGIHVPANIWNPVETVARQILIPTYGS